MTVSSKHNLDRRRVLAILGGLGAAALSPVPGSNDADAAISCAVSTPEVTEGPYWVEEKLFRSDIRTDPTTNVTKQGVPLALTITVINSSSGNCVPLVGGWVDIWHCDAIGIYSDESTYNPGGGTGNVNTQGQKFLRGYQITDSNGQVQFTTIYPGWYTSRTIHIHVRIRTWSDSNNTTTLSNYTTQLFFDDTITNTVLTQSPYSTRTSSRDTTNTTDSVYNGASNKSSMLLTLTKTDSGYTGAITIDASLLTATTTTYPAITTGGVTNAASGTAGTSPGAWISIYGTNLASTTYTLQSSDVVSNNLPTQLQGVSVQIDGKAAYIDYVSPTQVNVQAPADTTTGSVSVSLTNSVGVSNSVTATQRTFLPGLFAQSGYVLAVRPSDGVIINGSGASVSGYTTSATAKNGDILELFGTGFGPTQAGTAPGLVFSGADQSTNTVTITIGGKAATVLWAGLVGAGLWQINVQLPSGLSAGDNAVVASVSGNSTASSASIKIAAS